MHNYILNMSKFGGMSVDIELVDTIKNMLPPKSTIVELGSGDGSTSALSSIYNLYSIEHDIAYIGKYPSKYIYAPLINDFWYDRQVLIKELPLKYDLILVDGPIRHRRKGFIDNYDLFDQNVPIVLDDTHRAIEKQMILDLTTQYNQKILYQLKTTSGKEFTILIPKIHKMPKMA